MKNIITKRQIVTVLNVYKNAYKKIDKMNISDAYDYILVRNLSKGLCHFIDSLLDYKIDYSKLKLPDYAFKWTTPQVYYFHKDRHPKLGLKPRIKYLEKFLKENYK